MSKRQSLLMASLYTLVPHIPSYIFPYVGIIALVAGLLFAFFGNSIWKHLMALVGALLGASLGYAFAIPYGFIVTILVAFIGAVIGGFLFYYIAEAGIALLLAYFTFILVLFALGQKTSGLSTINHSLGADEVIAIIVALIVFVLALMYFDDLIAILTSLAGAILVDYGLTSFHVGYIATIIALVVFVAGMTHQFINIRKKKVVILKERESGSASEE